MPICHEPVISVKNGTRTRLHQSHNLAAYLFAFLHHMAREMGFEPILTGSEPVILPLNDSRMQRRASATLL